MSIGVNFAMVAAAFLLRAATPPVPAVFVHLPANQVTIDDIHVEAADQGRLQLRGWMCRRAPGPSVETLHILAFDKAESLVWTQTASAPHFDPGRPQQCRLLKVSLGKTVPDGFSHLTIE